MVTRSFSGNYLDAQLEIGRTSGVATLLSFPRLNNVCHAFFQAELPSARRNALVGATADSNRPYFFQTQCSASKTNESHARFLHFSHRKTQLVSTQRTDRRPSAFRRPDRDGPLRLACAGDNAVLGWRWRGCGWWRHRDLEHRAGALEPNVWRLGLPSLGQYQQRRRRLLRRRRHGDIGLGPHCQLARICGERLHSFRHSGQHAGFDQWHVDGGHADCGGQHRHSQCLLRSGARHDRQECRVFSPPAHRKPHSPANGW